MFKGSALNPRMGGEGVPLTLFGVHRPPERVLEMVPTPACPPSSSLLIPCAGLHYRAQPARQALQRLGLLTPSEPALEALSRCAHMRMGRQCPQGPRVRVALLPGLGVRMWMWAYFLQETWFP